MALSSFIKNYRKGTKEDLLYRLYVLVLSDILFGGLISISVRRLPNYSTILESSDSIFYASIGFLTFIAIFYSLIFSPAYQKKLKYFKNKIDEYVKDIDDNFDYLKKNISNKKQLKKIIKETESEINSTKFLKYSVKIDIIFYICVLSFVLSILLRIPHITPILFMLGVICLFHIVTALTFIFQDEYGYKSKRIDLVLDKYGRASRSFKIE